MNYIVTTTINSPTEALRRYEMMSDWELIVVGDLKTPHEHYVDFSCYLHPDEQHDLYPELSDACGWNSIQRRNIGFVYAWHWARREANDYVDQKGRWFTYEPTVAIATVDDDNIPYAGWGKDLIVGSYTEVDYWSNTETDVFDPLSVTNHPEIWHRGYPIEYVPTRDRVEYRGRYGMNVKVQAGLWDGDPDVDAMVRLSQKPIVKFDSFEPFGSNQTAPFNSQNTMIALDALPWYCVFPGVGRMDDIWGAYVFQHYFPDSVAFTKASVYQERNPQDLVRNLENEIVGYRNTLDLATSINHNEGTMLATMERLAIRDFWECYRSHFDD